MFSVKFALKGTEQMKRQFFDRVFNAADRAAKKGIERTAAYVRIAARNSIKPAAKHSKAMRARFVKGDREVYSAVGQPPLSKTGLLRMFIYYAWDASTKSAVIGPARINRGTEGAPHALEYGGTVKTHDGRPVRIRPRPYMRPAMLKAIKSGKFSEEIVRALRQAFKK